MPKRFTKSSAKRTKNSNNRWEHAAFKITNRGGMHTRPAAAFVKIAKKFPAKIEVRYGKTKVDGKSILNLLSLEAPRGERIEIRAKGVQAKTAIHELGKLIASGFYE